MFAARSSMFFPFANHAIVGFLNLRAGFMKAHAPVRPRLADKKSPANERG
jgi:hypothetical protein